MDKRKFIKKVSLVGDGGVGKTSLVRRYVLDVFSDEYIQTFGAKVTKKVIEVDDAELTMMIWDILGQKAQKLLHTSYYAGSNGGLVVCDLTREETLLNIPEWVEDLRRTVGNVPIIPVANKADLGATFSNERMREIADIVGNEFILTSAKTGDGVPQAFERLSKMMMEKK